MGWREGYSQRLIERKLFKCNKDVCSCIFVGDSHIRVESPFVMWGEIDKSLKVDNIDKCICNHWRTTIFEEVYKLKFRLNNGATLLRMPTMGWMTSLWGDDAENFQPKRWFDENGPFKFTTFQMPIRKNLYLSTQGRTSPPLVDTQLTDVHNFLFTSSFEH